MLDLAKLIHEAIGIESPRRFIVVCAIFGAIIFASLGWLIDRGYRAKLRAEAKAVPIVEIRETSGDATSSGTQSPANTGNGNSFDYNAPPLPAEKKLPKKE